MRASLAAALLLSLAGTTALLSAGLASAADSAPARKFDPNIDLPDSEGRELLLRSCTNCHELSGLAAYKGYWGRPQWLAMVQDMVKNGAVLLPAEQERVADYLARHFGRDQ